MAFRHLILGLGEDLRLHVEELDFLADDLRELPQPLDGVDDLQKLLRLVHLEPQVRAGDICEFPRLVYRVEDKENVGWNQPPHGDYFLHLLPDVAHERLGLEGDFRDERLFHGFYAHEERRPFLHVFFDLRLFYPLDEDFYPPVGKAQHPHDLRDDAHGVDFCGQRVFVGQVLLGDNEDEPVLRESFLHRVYRHLSSEKKRKRDRRIHHHVPYGEQGEHLRHF